MYTIKNCYCCNLSTCIKFGCFFCIVASLSGSSFLLIDLFTIDYSMRDIVSRLLILIFCLILIGFFSCLFLEMRKKDEDRIESVLALVKAFTSPIICIFIIQFFDSMIYLAGGRLDHGIRILIIASVVIFIMALFWFVMYSYYVQLKNNTINNNNIPNDV